VLRLGKVIDAMFASKFHIAKPHPSLKIAHDLARYIYTPVLTLVGTPLTLDFTIDSDARIAMGGTDVEIEKQLSIMCWSESLIESQKSELPKPDASMWFEERERKREERRRERIDEVTSSLFLYQQLHLYFPHMFATHSIPWFVRNV
jgi:hypothetical protein